MLSGRNVKSVYQWNIPMLNQWNIPLKMAFELVHTHFDTLWLMIPLPTVPLATCVALDQMNYIMLKGYYEILAS